MATVGQAIGVVTIDAQLEQAAGQIAQFSVRVEQQLARVSQATQQTESSFNQLTRIGKGLAGAFGISLGTQLVKQLSDAAIASVDAATAYDRQEVAARNLAGSQAQLNDLMEVYDRATGGVIDQSTQLANVTKLLSVGFADSAEELDQFATAIRGISIATGRTQDFATQNLILELFSQRGQRLDQLGLQYDKVRAAANKLQAADSDLTKQMAYQQAVLDQANQRFGILADSAEGAATGLEKMRKQGADLGLEIGQSLSHNLNAAGEAVAGLIDWFRDLRREIGQASKAMDEWFLRQFNIVPMTSPLASRNSLAFGTTPTAMGDSGPQIDQLAVDQAVRKHYDDILQLERRTNQQLSDENSNYNRQRLKMERDFGNAIADAAADYAKQRQRSIDDYERTVNRVERDYQDQRIRMVEDHTREMERMQRDHDARLADMAEQLDRTIDERRADSAERLAEALEDRDEDIEKQRRQAAERLVDVELDFNRQREQAARAHQDSLTEAAARLDARAVWQANRRYAREQEDAERAHAEKVADEQKKLDEAIRNLNDAYNEKVADEQKALDKSIKQAQDAYARQVEDENEAFAQRQADANDAYERQLADLGRYHVQRLADMAADFSDELRQRDDDQVERMAQMREDHAEQMTEFDNEHKLRIDQIGKHAEAERTAIDENFKQTLLDLGTHNDQWEKEEAAHHERALKAHELFLLEQERLALESIKRRLEMEATAAKSLGMAISLGESIATLDSQIDDLTDRIGDVQKEFDALPLPGEANADVSAALVGAAAFTMPTNAYAPVTATTAGGGVAIGELHLHGAPTDSPRQFAEMFRAELLKTMREMGGRR